MAEQNHEIAQTQVVQQIILVEARAAGGCLTYGQMQLALKDVASLEIRAAAIRALVAGGDLLIRGSGTSAFYELTRPGDVPSVNGLLTVIDTRLSRDLAHANALASFHGGLQSTVARLPHALAERLQSIEGDINDALRDACDARAPHDLMGHLLDAQRALGKASQANA